MGSIIKKLVVAFSFCFVLISLSNAKAVAQPRNGISLQVFYDELSYYGDWVNNPDYGYVWRPNVGNDFKPYYTNGHWVMTEYGNTWVSDYEWGWAPFHYGRWFYDNYDGWIWMPDTEWGPAWVSWRTGGGYYGWAPLGPRVSISISLGRNYYIPNNYWVFIPQRCIYYPSYGRYYDPRRNNYWYGNTTIINNIYINNNVRYTSGPRADDVRRATRQDVPIYRISDNSRPGSTRVSGNSVNIYRPEVSRGGNDRSAPKAIANNNSRPSRGDVNINNRTNDGNIGARPSRDNDTRNSSPRQDGNSSENRSNRPDASRDMPNREERISSPTRTERSEPSNRPSTPNRTESSDNGRSQNVERSQTAPTRESARSRSESSSSNSRPQNVERSQPAQTRESAPSRSESSSNNSRPQSVERSQPSSSGQSSSRSSGGSSSSSSRGGSSSSNGRPSR